MAKYKNIPVLEEVYENVKLLSGDRGMGEWVKQQVERVLPDCGHAKQPISIEIFPNATELNNKQIRNGLFCATCNRVYEYAAHYVGATKQETPFDPYGQPLKMPKSKTKKKVKAEAVTS